MGTSLSGLTPATTFDGLLKTSDNEPLDGTLKAISTGEGTDTILQLSNSALSIGGDVSITSTTSGLGASAFLVQNSSGEELLNIYDGGSVRLGGSGNTTTRANIELDSYSGLFNVTSAKFANFNGATFAVFQGLSKSDALFAFGNDAITASTRMHIKGLGASAGTTSLLVQNSEGNDILTIKDDRSFKISSSAGTVLDIDANGSQLIGTSSRATVFNGSASYFLRNLGVGETTPTAKLQVKGSGATSATTALLVQNSAGTELFRIKDNYTTQITTDGSSDPALYLNTGVGRENASGGLSIGSTTSTFNINSRYADGVINASGKLNLTSSVAIGGNYNSATGGYDASAILAVSSTTQGFLPPRMTTTERDAINMVGDPAVSTPATGLIIYNTTTNKAQCYNGTTWNDLF